MLDIHASMYDDLPQARRYELAAAAANAFDRFPIVRQTTWATPDWGRRTACCCIWTGCRPARM